MDSSARGEVTERLVLHDEDGQLLSSLPFRESASPGAFIEALSWRRIKMAAMLPKSTLVIEGPSVSLPLLCACCLRDATHEVTVAKEKRTELIVASMKRTMSIRVPHCEPCSRHVTWSAAYVVAHAFVLVLVLALVGLVATVAITSRNPSLVNEQGPILLVLACVLPLVGALAYARYKLRGRPDDLSGSEHTRRQVALEILDFAKDSITLGIYNERYAEAVRGLNKLSSTAGARA